MINGYVNIPKSIQNFLNRTDISTDFNNVFIDKIYEEVKSIPDNKPIFASIYTPSVKNYVTVVVTKLDVVEFIILSFNTYEGVITIAVTPENMIGKLNE